MVRSTIWVNYLDPLNIPPNNPLSSLIDPISSFELIVPLWVMGVFSIHQEDLEDHDSQGPSLPFEKALASIRRGGVLWFQSWNSESTQRMCYNGHLLYPLRKALTSIHWSGVLWFRSRNSSTHHMCYTLPHPPILKGALTFKPPSCWVDSHATIANWRIIL